jgi:hypothetical protein
MKKPVGAFRDYANAPKTVSLEQRMWYECIDFSIRLLFFILPKNVDLYKFYASFSSL